MLLSIVVHCLPISSIVLLLVLTELGRVLPTECQKFLQTHDLIVEFDLPLGEGPVSLLWIRRCLSQLADFLRDCGNFSAIVDLILVLVVLVIDLVLLLMLLLIHVILRILFL